MNNKEKFIEIYNACIKREGADAFLNYLIEKTDFFTAPASTRFHGAYEGGLLEHSLNVYECLCNFVKRPHFCDKYGFSFTEESLAAATKSVKICGVKTNATINLATGVANANGNATEVTPYFENGQYRALIVPQTTEEGALVVVTVDGVDYTLSRSMTFKANKQHKFTVTLNKVNNGVNVGIGGWETDEEDYGGSAE